jgi:hypothetical protein
MTIIGISNNALSFKFIDHLKEENPILAIAVSTFSLDYGSINHVESDLEKIAENLKCLVQELARKRVRQDCQIWQDRIVQELAERKRAQELELAERKRAQELELAERKRAQELEERKKRELLEARRQQSINLRSQLDEHLSRIRDTNPKLYEKVFTKTHFDSVPQLSLKDEKYSVILVEYEQSLRDKALKLSREVNNFYTTFNTSQLGLINVDIKNAKIELEKVEQMENILYIIYYIVPFCFLLSVMHWVGAIAITIFIVIPISSIVETTVERKFIKNIKDAAKETLDKARNKKINERHKLDAEKQKILKLLQL